MSHFGRIQTEDLSRCVTSSERDGHFHAKSVSGGMAPVNGICESIQRERRGGVFIYLKVGGA